MSKWLPYLIFSLAVAIYLLSSVMEEKHEPGRPHETTVTFWAFSYPAQTMLELKPLLERENPGLKVEVQTVAWEHLQQKTLWAIAANSNVPDVIVGSSEWLGGLVHAGALEPLDGDILDDAFFERYFPTALEIYKYPDVRGTGEGNNQRKRQYGIPLDLDLMLAFYRADVLEPLLEKRGMGGFPQTWEQLLELGRAVNDEFQTSQPHVKLLVLDPEDPVPMSMAFLPASGAQILDPKSFKPVFQSPEGCAAFSFFYRLLATNCAVRWERGTMEDPFVLFKTTRALVCISGPWYRKVLERRAPELAGKWRIAKFPRRQPHFPSSGLGGACLAVPYNAPHKTEAKHLIRFLASDTFALQYFRRVGSPPPQKTAWNDPIFDQPVPYFGGQRIYETIRVAIETARPTQLLPNTQITRDHLRRALKSIADGAPIQETLEHAAQEVELLLAQ
ncbi:MAG: extracellular solute-binding protein [Candidatus Sumerlaeaceae bacterium]|nr:extracellular solute-binding protein [Candidatus Sumerlaeaceae bacterium]